MQPLLVITPQRKNMFTSEELLGIINQGLTGCTFDRKPEGLYAPIRYVLSLGGKRIRPILVLMAYNLYKDNIEEALQAALGLETYHNYTLLHDDLMDKAEMRRSHPTVHKRWNDNTAILSGDSMQVLAFLLMGKVNDNKLRKALNLFTETALEIGEGQQYDIDFEHRNDVTEEEYIEMIRLKTSVLLACALKLGALLADAPENDLQQLYRFGESLGLAFQLQDDYLDVYGDPAVFGKKIGGDILCNKKTYMLINALQKADKQQREDLVNWINATEFDPQKKISEVTRIYNEIGIRELCNKKIHTYFEDARKALEKVEVLDERKANLWNFALSLLNRTV